MHYFSDSFTIRKLFKQIFKYDSDLFKINIECLNFDDNARIEIEIPLSTLDIERLNEFVNEFVEQFNVDVTANIYAKKSTIYLVLATRSKKE